ncbi:hypothetical protein ABTL37_20110, partial [Acinetobacter baumannii]
ALADPSEERASSSPAVVLSENGRLRGTFHIDSDLRPDARQSIDRILSEGQRVEIMSGDRDEPVRRLAATLGVPYLAGVSPSE